MLELYNFIIIVYYYFITIIIIIITCAYVYKWGHTSHSIPMEGRRQLSELSFVLLFWVSGFWEWNSGHRAWRAISGDYGMISPAQAF